MLHSVEQRFAVKHVDVEMMSAIDKVSVKQADEIGNFFNIVASESVGEDAEGVADTVFGVVVRKF